MSRVVQIFGSTGTGKSRLALTAPGRKWYAEMDPGSYARGSAGIKLQPDEVDLHQFAVPLTSLLDRGVLDFSMVGGSGKGAVQVAHRYKGWNEEWWKFVDEYMQALKGDYSTLIIDTSTLLWDMAQNALRQRIQEGGGTEDYQSDRLKRLEFQEPSSQMNSIVMGAKGANKNLVLIAHRGEVWFNDKPTGTWKPDGWNKAMDGSDVSIMLEVKGHRPAGFLFKGDMDLTGMEVPEPTFSKLEQVLEVAQALRLQGFEVPASYDELMDAGQMVLPGVSA